MSPNLIILLQNVSLKAQLLEICNEMRNFGFATKVYEPMQPLRRLGNRSDPTAKSVSK